MVEGGVGVSGKGALSRLGRGEERTAVVGGAGSWDGSVDGGGVVGLRNDWYSCDI